MRRSLRLHTKTAIGERLQQILDEQIASLLASSIRRDPTLFPNLEISPDNATSGKSHESALPKEVECSLSSSNGPTQRALAEARRRNVLENRKFAQTYQKEIGYVASESLLRSKAARLMADPTGNKPWDGSLLTTDTALRMITDVVPQPKPTKPQNRIITPPKPWHERVKAAKELSMDYKVGTTDKEKDEFREMYRERLLGPSMFVNPALSHATLGLIGTLADARINEAIDQKTGKFNSADMDSVRGKPLDRARLANSSDTSFFINDILNRQDCLPPWIEGQQGTEREILAFRRTLQKKWFTILLSKLEEERAAALSKAQTASFKNYSTHTEDFERLHFAYTKKKVSSLNQEIRNYNLQCPSPSLHKWKLVLEKEVQNGFDEVVLRLDDLINEWFDLQKKTGADPKFGGKSNHGQLHMYRQGPESLGLWKSVKLLFGK